MWKLLDWAIWGYSLGYSAISCCSTCWYCWFVAVTRNFYLNYVTVLRLSVAPANKLYTINATRADWTGPLTRNPPPKIDKHCEAVGIKTVASFLRLACEFNLCIIAMTAATATCNMPHAAHSDYKMSISASNQQRDNKKQSVMRLTHWQRPNDWLSEQLTKWPTD